MKKIYLSGPIRGKLDLNRAAFDRAGEFADGRGWSSVNPLDLIFRDPDDIREVMGACIDTLLGCDAILMLDGWNVSRGALAEFYVARSIEMPDYHMTADVKSQRLPDISVKLETADIPAGAITDHTAKGIYT